MRPIVIEKRYYLYYFFVELNHCALLQKENISGGIAHPIEKGWKCSERELPGACIFIDIFFYVNDAKILREF